MRVNRWIICLLLLAMSSVFLLWILGDQSLIDDGVESMWRGEGFRPFIKIVDSLTDFSIQSHSLEVILLKTKGLFSRLAAMLVTITAIPLFILAFRSTEDDLGNSWLQKAAMMTTILILGTGIRLMLAYELYGNYDQNSYEIVTDILRHGGNVYVETSRYNYSPVWFYVLHTLDYVHQNHSGVPFHFVVRSFLTLIDAGSFVLLVLIARRTNQSVCKTALFFYVNPVSFLITGFHGQFENVTVFLLLGGIYCYYRWAFSRATLALLWIFSTAAMIIKHNVFYQVIIFIRQRTQGLLKTGLFFGASVLLFLLSFIPHLNKESWDAIVNNAFLYSSSTNWYGTTFLIKLSCLKYLFLLGLLWFSYRRISDDLIDRALCGMLFFLTFTTGLGIQYFVLPIALGALRPSPAYVIYSIVCGLFLLGSGSNCHLPGFNCLNINLVWLAVAYWFVSTQFRIRITAQPSLS